MQNLIMKTIDVDANELRLEIVGNSKDTLCITQKNSFLEEMDQIFLKQEGMDQIFLKQEDMAPMIVSMLAVRNCWLLGITGQLYGYNGRYICALQGQLGEEANLICVCDMTVLDVNKPAVDVYSQKIRVGDAISIPFNRLQPFSPLS